MPTITVPASFRAQPRWWHDGTVWLDALPDLADTMLRRWHLTQDGAPMHGSNALVVPVRRGSTPLALRLAPPDDRLRGEIAALRFWDGRGTVRLVDADVTLGAALLERLDASRSLATRPLAEAMPVIGELIVRLAVPMPPGKPPDVPATDALARGLLASMPADWDRLGRPFARATLDAALGDSSRLATTSSEVAVNGDLHAEQVLAAPNGGEREPWLVVDPVLLRGDAAYDIARVLWTSLDRMADDAEIRRCLDAVIGAAGLDRANALSWVRLRTLDYWLWGLDYGLTEDPVRCARLLTALPDR